jgi:hypothetical protein
MLEEMEKSVFAEVPRSIDNLLYIAEKFYGPAGGSQGKIFEEILQSAKTLEDRVKAYKTLKSTKLIPLILFDGISLNDLLYVIDKTPADSTLHKLALLEFQKLPSFCKAEQVG